ncbi:hypothetical protein MAR_033627 [Mya arenaria]|uniref:Uncharacterized protein n=1 Tax=Mya arenaria TaxID=6604 RepID=A0ABY7G9K5_MYAAR|nr:hypothetical protein MAR_033627 [Mya arenaria]
MKPLRIAIVVLLVISVQFLSLEYFQTLTLLHFGNDISPVTRAPEDFVIPDITELKNMPEQRLMQIYLKYINKCCVKM